MPANAPSEAAATAARGKAGGRRRGRSGRGRGRGRGRGGGGGGANGGGGASRNGRGGGGAPASHDAGNGKKPDAPPVNGGGGGGGDSDDSRVCQICAEVAKDLAVGPCMHPICSGCSHRMRVLYKREDCTICKKLLTEVVVVPVERFDPAASFRDLQSMAVIKDPEVNMRFVDPVRRDELAAYRGFTCSVDGHVAPTGPKLKAYARSAHNSMYCNLCFGARQVFKCELALYPVAKGGGCPKLKQHIKATHPRCNFCHTVTFDDDVLYQHLQTNHETCGICERRGIVHVYYRNYAQLEAHYKDDHHPCLEPECRGVVFATAVELAAHRASHHMAGAPRSQRTVRLDLADLRTTPAESPEDLREEQNRQAARRRAFAASHVVYSNESSSNPSRPTDDARRNPNSSRTQNSRASSSRPLPQASAPRAQVQAALSQPTPPTTTSSRLPPPGDSRPPPQAVRPPPVSQRAPPAQTAAPAVHMRSSGAASSAGRPRTTGSSREGQYVSLPLPQSQEEAEARSRALMRTMRDTLDAAAFETFKEASAEFRDGTIDASAYYNATIDAFGVRQALRDVIPELIALMPDVHKRTELTNAVCGRLGVNHVAPQSTIDFPSLEGQRPAAPNLTPTMRSGYLPVPQANDFPSLAGRGRANASRPTTTAQPMPALNMQRVFGGGATTTPNLPVPRRTHRNLTDAFGPFPALSSADSPAIAAATPPPVPLRVRTRPTPPAATTPTPLRARPDSVPPPPLPTAFPSLGSTRSSAASPPFPSLGVISAGLLESERAQRAAETQSEERTSDPDVTNRAGAVWGGASTGRRKRGPGRGPAPMPGTERPALGEGGERETLSLAAQVRETQSENRRRIEQSALPRVGAGGFGFQWERKAQQRKKKQIRKTFNDANNEDKKDGDGGNSGTSAA